MTSSVSISDSNPRKLLYISVGLAFVFFGCCTLVAMQSDKESTLADTLFVVGASALTLAVYFSAQYVGQKHGQATTYRYHTRLLALIAATLIVSGLLEIGNSSKLISIPAGCALFGWVIFRGRKAGKANQLPQE